MIINKIEVITNHLSGYTLQKINNNMEFNNTPDCKITRGVLLMPRFWPM